MVNVQLDQKTKMSVLYLVLLVSIVLSPACVSIYKRSQVSLSRTLYNYLHHLRWKKVMFSPLSVCLFVLLFIRRISQKVVDESGWCFVDKLGVWQGRTDSILVKIQIRIRGLFNFLSDSSPLKDGAKNEIFVGPDMFNWIRHCAAEVCAQPSALLVLKSFCWRQKYKWYLLV